MSWSNTCPPPPGPLISSDSSFKSIQVEKSSKLLGNVLIGDDVHVNNPAYTIPINYTLGIEMVDTVITLINGAIITTPSARNISRTVGGRKLSFTTTFVGGPGGGTVLPGIGVTEIPASGIGFIPENTVVSVKVVVTNIVPEFETYIIYKTSVQN